MKCSEAPEILISLLYDELSEPEKQSVEKHVKQCDTCRETFQELQSTSQFMMKWEDESPPGQTVFIEEKSSVWRWVKHLGRAEKLAWGIPVFATACLILLSLTQADIHVQNGNFRLTFGRQSPDESQIEARLASAMKAYQQEQTQQFVNMLKESEARQNQNMTLAMNGYARSIDRQQQNYLKLVDQGLQGYQRQTNGQLIRTQSMIDNLIKNTSHAPDQDNR